MISSKLCGTVHKLVARLVMARISRARAVAGARYEGINGEGFSWTSPQLKTSAWPHC